MADSVLNRLRTWWFNVHLWIGVGLFVLLVPLGLTGTVLVYHDEIDHLTHPERFAVSQSTATLGPAAYLDAAGKAFAGKARPTRITYPDDAGAPVVVSGLPSDFKPGARPRPINAWLDPADGHALSVGPGMDGIVRWSHDFHGQLLVPPMGRSLVGWLGVIMLIQSLTGIWLWWPRGGSPLRAFRWGRTGFVGMNIHHLIGFWLSIPLAILSVTGVWISFPQIGRAFAPPPPAGFEGRMPGGRGGPGGPGGPGGRPGFSPPIANPQLTADQALQAAQDLDPNSRVVSISLPTEGGRRPSWQVQLKPVGEARPVTIRVSDATGEAREGFGGPGGGANRDPLSRAMRQIHDGDDTGPIWKLIVALTGLAPAILGVTGLIRWATSRRRRPVPAA